MHNKPRARLPRDHIIHRPALRDPAAWYTALHRRGVIRAKFRPRSAAERGLQGTVLLPKANRAITSAAAAPQAAGDRSYPPPRRR